MTLNGLRTVLAIRYLSSMLLQSAGRSKSWFSASPGRYSVPQNSREISGTLKSAEASPVRSRVLPVRGALRIHPHRYSAPDAGSGCFRIQCFVPGAVRGSFSLSYHPRHGAMTGCRTGLPGHWFSGESARKQRGDRPGPRRNIPASGQWSLSRHQNHGNPKKR